MRKLLCAHFACIAILTSVAGGKESVSSRETLEVRKLCEGLRVGPLVLSGAVMLASDKEANLRATATLSNVTNSALAIPTQVAGGTRSRLGEEIWYIQRIDGKRGVRTFWNNRTREMERAVVNPGESIELAETVYANSASASLETGEYELTVEFVATNRRVIGSSRARFKVINPDSGDMNRKREESEHTPGRADRALKSFFRNIEPTPVALESRTLRRGDQLVARCGLRNKARSEILVPNDQLKPGVDGTRRIALMKCQVRDRSGATLQSLASLGIVWDDRKTLGAGEVVEFSASGRTDDLAPGKYEVVFEFLDAADQLIGRSAEKFTVTR